MNREHILRFEGGEWRVGGVEFPSIVAKVKIEADEWYYDADGVLWYGSVAYYIDVEDRAVIEVDRAWTTPAFGLSEVKRLKLIASTCVDYCQWQDDGGR